MATLLEGVARRTEEDHTVEAMLTEGEVLPTIRISVHRHMALPSSRTALLYSTSLLRRLIRQHLYRPLNPGKAVSRPRKRNSSALRSHRQVPDTNSTHPDPSSCDSSNPCRSLHAPRLPARPRPGQAGSLQAVALQERLRPRGTLLSFSRTHAAQCPDLSAFPGGAVHQRGLSLCTYSRQPCSSDL